MPDGALSLGTGWQSGACARCWSCLSCWETSTSGVYRSGWLKRSASGMKRSDWPERLLLRRRLTWSSISIIDECSSAAQFREGASSIIPVDGLQAEAARALRNDGLRAVVVLPMSLLGRSVGLFLIYVFDGVPEPTCERIEVAQAL